MKIGRHFITSFKSYIESRLFGNGYPADNVLKRDLQGVLALDDDTLATRPVLQMPWAVYRVNLICGGSPEIPHPLCLALFLFSRLITIVDDMQDNDELRCGQRAYWALNGRDNTELASLTLLSLAYRFLNLTGEFLPGEAAAGCVELFSDMFLKTTEGQRLDLALSRNLDCGMDGYLDMARFKNGVIYSCIIALGVLCARHNVATAREVYRTGIHLGLALQFLNDMQDLMPQRARLGRDRNSDFFEGRISLPFVYGRNTLPPAKRDRLMELYRKEAKTMADQDEVDALMAQSGVAFYAGMLVDSHIQKGVEGLLGAGLSQAEIEQILDLIDVRALS